MGGFLAIIIDQKVNCFPDFAGFIGSAISILYLAIVDEVHAI